MKSSPDPFLSIVIPCYNEEEVLPLLRARITQALKDLAVTWEVVLVDDGSSDSSFERLALIHAEDPRFKGVSFSRNFGHQAAVFAGLRFASGDVVAVMDADLQDPPEILPGCIELLRNGHDVVYAVRRKRKEHWMKVAAYQLFYRILKLLAEVHIPLDSGDFCVMNRRVVNVLTAMPERNVFVRGLRAWAGFKQISLEYEREARAAGETKYPLAKLFRLAADGVFSFSTAPLRLATVLGFGATAIAVLAVSFVLLWRVAGFRFMGYTAHQLPGWTAVIAAVLFLSGVQLLILGFMGEYLGRIYSEVKQRPRWIVRESLGLSASFSSGDHMRDL
ncbi:glycosyltransferase family 2 protein [Verrucomicrobiota bacterium sgz303538]